MKVFILCLIALYFISGEATFTFDGSRNASLSNSDEFKYRATTFGKWSLLLWSGAWFGTFGADHVPSSGQVNIDAIWASCYVGTGNFPASWIAHFDADATYQITPQANFDFAKADVNTSSGFMGTGYLRLEEVTPNGAVVKNISFNSLIWTEDSTSGSFGAANNLYWATYKGSKLGSPLSVKLAFATASVYGYLSADWLNAFISPKTLESFVSIDGWEYADQANSLRLATVVATKSAQLTANGQLYINDGEEQVNFFVTKKARIGGSVTEDIKVSSFTEVDLDSSFQNNDFSAQIKGKYGSNSKAYLVYTTFPPGANQILLDPTMSVGPQPDFSSASSLTCAFGLVALLALAFIGL